MGGLRLWLLLIPSAGLTGRRRKAKQAGYRMSKGNASAGSWAWERDEH